jgi:dUTP pyrophosphatase
MDDPTTLVRIVRLPNLDGLELPFYATEGAAGMDVRAATPEGETWVLKPGERRLVPTGFAIAVPRGHECQVRPRSGLALRHGITCLNTPGTVDSDFRGEVGVILVNLGQEDFPIRRGDRIAQLVIAAYERVAWNEVDQLEETERGEGGFGSTGKR